MGLFERLFGKSHKEASNETQSTETKIAPVDDQWQEVPAYVETDPENYQLVSVIATAIASGDQPESQFVVKKILERNPEAKLVSLIASSIAAGDHPDSQLVVKRIAKKKS